MEEKFISLSAAAKQLGISRVSAWRWVRDGRLQAVKVGRNFKIRPGLIVDRLLADNASGEIRRKARKENE